MCSSTDCCAVVLVDLLSSDSVLVLSPALGFCSSFLFVFDLHNKFVAHSKVS